MLEVRSMPNWHRIGTNCVRTNPPIVSVHTNFFWSDVVRVVFVRQFVHLTTYFFIATDVKHILAELLVADEPVLLAFLIERTRDEVLTRDPLASFRIGARGVVLSLCSNWESRGDPWCTGQISCSPFRFARSARTCNRRYRRPSMIDILCTVLWFPYRVVHTIRCSQLHESIISFDCWLKGLND